jgi:hypothetical protein
MLSRLTNASGCLWLSNNNTQMIRSFIRQRTAYGMHFVD